ncbi:MAG: hypothetical protein GY803_15480 [Chloroflexi bacterium]|nr:hypothetical protein [Chloroflexota bacterium]
MFQRIANSWQLVKASAAVLRADKELLVFPIVSAVGTLIVTATFLFPMIFAGFLDQLASGGRVEFFGYIIAFLFYLVQYSVIFFANTALVGAAMIRLRGGDPTVGDGFRIAFEHIGSILGYAAISATVGMILRWLSERSGVIGRIATSLVGLAWNLATYLVVPVLVVEGVGPVEAVKRSANLLKKTWGEQIAGNLSVGLIFGLFTLLLFIIGLPLIFLAVSTGELFVIGGAIFLFVMALILLGLINSALSGIYAAAVYRYAAEGEMGAYFDESQVTNAFKIK